jgi:hypothetical protein
MKSLFAIGCGLLLAVGPASAADGGVPQEPLARMGLGNMTVMSDEQGSEVRGTPFVFWPPDGAVFEIQAFRLHLVFPWTYQLVFRP